MRCAYRYADGEQCIFTNLPADKSMCTDHRLITRMAKDKKANDARRYPRIKATRPSRAKPKAERVTTPKLAPPPESYIHDHTAPWGCGVLGCGRCKGKPSYRDYMIGRYG